MSEGEGGAAPGAFRWTPARLVLVGLLLAGGAWSLATLRFQTELLPLFPPDLPSVQALQKIQRSLASGQLLVVADPDPGAEALDGVAAKLRGVPGVAAVRAGFGGKLPAASGPGSDLFAGWIALRSASLPPDRFAALQKALRPDQALKRLRDTRDRLGGALDQDEAVRLRLDPLRVSEIVFDSRAGAALSPGLARPPPLLTVEAAAPLRTFEENRRFAEAVRAALPQAGKTEAQTRWYLTGPPAFTAQISRDMRRDVIVMVLFTVSLVCAAFWLVYRSLRPLAWIVAIQGMAFLAALVTARLVFGQLNVLSIGFASILPGLGIDYSILVYHAFARERIDPAEWRGLRRAIRLSALATALTFGLLVLSGFPGLRQLAVLVSVGLLAAAFLATTVLAGFLAGHRPVAPGRLDAVSDAAAAFLRRARRPIQVLALLAVAAALALVPWWQHHPGALFDAGVERLQPTHLEAYQGQEILQKYAPQLPPPTGDERRALRENRPAWTPVDPAALRGAFHQAGFSADWAALSLRIVDSLNRWHAGELDLAATPSASGPWDALRADLARVTLADCKRLSLLALLAVIGFCVLAHRSLRLTLLNLGALAVSMALFVLLLAATGTAMTVVSLVCVPLKIGLTIAYSFYILIALEQADGDLARAFRRLAVPLGLTGIASLVGFTAQILTTQPALRNFGLVMDLGMVSALASGLLVVPAFYRHGARAGCHQSRSLYNASMFSLGLVLARFLPLPLLRALGAGGGFLYAALRPGKARVAAANLRLLDPRAGMPGARRLFASFGATLADYLHLGARPARAACGLVSERRGTEHLEALREAGQGALLVTAHFGLFELGGFLASDLGLPVTVLTRPEPSAALTAWRARFRARWGVETVEVGDDPFAFLAIAERLRAGRLVAALVDRPGPSGTGVPVRLPHGTAMFSSGILLLALECDVPVIPAVLVRGADGRYRAEVFAPLRLDSRGTRAETLRFHTQRIADILLPVLCAHPEQWYQFVPLSSSSPARS